MGLLKKLALAAAISTLTAAAAAAQTTVKWLHIEVNPGQVKIWEEVARDFEAKHPGVKVEMQFLENEAYKAKLPTILQSTRPPAHHLQLGRRRAEGADRRRRARGHHAPGRRATRTISRRRGRGLHATTARSTACRMRVSQVGFMYNKELFAKAGVDGAKIKTWDDLLAAVKTLKAAGVTPIVVGGADKWPLHFYWTHLAVRARRQAGVRGGAEGRERRLRRRDVPEVRRAVQAARRSAAVPERLPRLQESAGGRLFRRRQGGDDRSPSRPSMRRSARWRPTSRGSATRSSAGSTFPCRPAARASRPTRSAASTAG